MARGVDSLAHAELFATVIPGLRVWPEAGLVGSLLWLGRPSDGERPTVGGGRRLALSVGR